MGARQDCSPPRLRTRLLVPRPSSQPEGVRALNVSSSQAKGDCEQEAWLLAPARLRPTLPRGPSSLLCPWWPGWGSGHDLEHGVLQTSDSEMTLRGGHW